MQARRAARELALILFSQFEKVVSKYSAKDFNDILLKSVRILTNNATNDLKLTIGPLIDMKQYIDEYEADHETNLARPIDFSNVPVPIPMTSDMKQKIDELLEIAEKALMALEIAEFTTLENTADVQAYTLKIAEAYKKHHDEVDAQIKEYAIGWDFNRLIKVDKDIMRIAITELMFVEEVPHKVVVDEAVELAKKYSTEDSSSFINGVLAKVIYENGIK
ncbi:transcription antitermination factor NusB [bacterium]|nr:transcription antitermination factor NusB [bacterium]